MSYVNPSTLWRSGAIATAVGVSFGAFGAHGLRKRPGITPDRIQAWQSASHYTIFNGLALMLISTHPRFSTHPFAGPAIGLGTCVFAGTIYLLVFNREKFKFLGPFTPMGGLSMIAGYLTLAL
ncbi:hypothetical protein FRC08_017250 [Ceratobasidium sp. 394]|nr:hypothetical protein FRC08_017250 [Ceratobasidium sp. 394]